VNKIFLKSCERMDEIQNETVDLIVTSPPYWNAIDYDVHTVVWLLEPFFIKENTILYRNTLSL